MGQHTCDKHIFIHLIIYTSVVICLVLQHQVPQNSASSKPERLFHHLPFLRHQDREVMRLPVLESSTRLMDGESTDDKRYLDIGKACRGVKTTQPQRSQFICDSLKHIRPPVCAHPVLCQSDITFFTKHDILNGLRGQWLLLLGDSTTRGLAMALIEQLDDTQTHHHDLHTWYNVTQGQGRHWRGQAGDFCKLDYVFRRGSSGEWVIAYKKVCLPSWVNDHEKMYDPSLLPDCADAVFVPDRKTLSPDEVRISYHMVRGTRDLHKVWTTKIPGNPDVVYVNVGEWENVSGWERRGNVCDLTVLRDVKSSTPVFIWGTVQRHEYSNCDLRVTGLESMSACFLRTRPNVKWRRTGLGDLLIVDRSLSCSQDATEKRFAFIRRPPHSCGQLL